ncbi:MAG: SDR family oxidoreductase [Gemmatimonadaceae bacterium]|nr:SDR family oxidoreductase [Gemmatimonadaceae bacterium]NUO96024.1 SDR family oxidoreductase [Gemmatimonadaceae bacterium]NUP55233.1 SDR family oxidoreductase [Gemmatimonadaceae bacterium]NUR33651.1 SDR family oxidoreductase [Gemmatimonadaceae bacterium]NUS32633.1 SDR family oxidoreductase [Gemmatimonadaceae bacterium]
MSTPTRSTSSEQLLARYRAAAERTAEQQRAIQVEVDRKDERAAKQKKDQKSDKRAVQAGVRTQPENPLPKQHLAKPGLEVQLEPRPRFLAPDYKGSEKLKNMVAIVTGGDSGIGRAVAVLFAREGADVAIVYLNEHEDAEETRRAVEDEGRRCITISGDVRDPEFCTFAVEHTVNELGHLEVLVNNAAFQEHVTSLEELSDEHLEMTMRTNVFGYVQMARAALPYLPPGGSIINTGSETGFFGAPQLLDYSATKGAIHAFTMALAGNVKSRDIRVNAIAPGPVWTPLNPADKPAEKVSEFGAESDMQRPAQPEELAPAYVFLASPVCSSYITGVLLPVMGGAQG